MFYRVVLEYGYNCTLIGLVNVLLNVVALQRLLQRLNLVAVLLTGTASNYVYIDLSVVRVLGDEGVLSGVQVCLQRIVAVDNSKVNVCQRTRQLLSSDLLNVQVLRVLGDIQLGSVRGRVNAVLQLEQTGILQQKQCAGLVGAVVRDGNGSAFSSSMEAVLPA